MSPVSLLFSSDEEMSRLLGQAFRELDFDVEYCPEIFGAIEKLTSRTYDVVVADWSEGPEAMFVLKTAHELESNRKALTIAIAEPETTAAARQAGAELVMTKPIIPQKAKHAMLTCSAFVDHLPAWLPKFGFQAPEQRTATQAGAPTTERPWPIGHEQRQRPSSSLTSAGQARVSAVVPAFAFEDNFEPSPAALKAFSPGVRTEAAESPVRNYQRIVLSIATVLVTGLSVGYAYMEPGRRQDLMMTVGSICGRALDRTKAWLHGPDTIVEASTQPTTAPGTMPNASPAPARVENIRLAHGRNPAAAREPASKPNEPTPMTLPSTSEPRQLAELYVPDSLKDSPHTNTGQTVPRKSGSSLATSLEPVDLPEDLARKLLVETVLPRYPEEALRAGMQGQVVLQAWIGRDGSVLDLKLIHGSFLLGQAAYQAVKRWRFQPFVRNGQALQAQTYITVHFKLP
jgi:periplasmic protein TonB